MTITVCGEQLASIEQLPQLIKMKDIRITSTEGQSWIYVIRVKKAFSDMQAVAMHDMTIDGHMSADNDSSSSQADNLANSFITQVPTGKFRNDKMEGDLSGGLVITLNKSHRMLTDRVAIK